MADDEDLSQQPEALTRATMADDVRSAMEQVADKLVTDGKQPTEDKVTTDTRPRDEHGKFLPKTVEAQATDAPVPETTDADRPAEQAAQPSNAAGPPRGWSADAKAAWAQLPPSIQTEVSRREAEINEGGRQWSEQKRGYEQALAPVQSLSQQYQMPATDVVARLVTVEQRLSDPRQAPQVIAELANAYGVNLTALASGTQQPAARQAPTIDLNAVRQAASEQVRQELSEAEQQRQTNAQIERFGSEKDAAGNPKYPHFSDPAVKTRMGRLLASEDASTMEDAYDQAVWSIPSIRSQLTASMKPQAAAQAQVVKAKNAKVSLNGSPRGAAPINRNDNSRNSVTDDVRAAVESLRA